MQFSGGKLRYWHLDDKKKTQLELFQHDDCIEFDTKQEAVVFDGNLCHEVEAFNGERYSAVLFTAKNYKQATDTQIQADLAAMGCNCPPTDTLRRLTSLLPMPDAAGQRK